MEPLRVYVAPSKNANEDAQQLLLPLVEMLRNEFQNWCNKKPGKTSLCVIKNKVAFEMALSFVREDNIKAAIITIEKNGNFVKESKAIWRGKKAERVLALKYYQAIVGRFIAELE
jgi:hypothetical protein